MLCEAPGTRPIAGSLDVAHVPLLLYGTEDEDNHWVRICLLTHRAFLTHCASLYLQLWRARRQHIPPRCFWTGSPSHPVSHSRGMFPSNRFLVRFLGFDVKALPQAPNRTKTENSTAQMKKRARSDYHIFHSTASYDDSERQSATNPGSGQVAKPTRSSGR